MKSSFYHYHHRYHSEELRRERNEVRCDAYFVKRLVVFYSLLCVMDKTLSLTRDARKMKCRFPLLSLSLSFYIYIYISRSERFTLLLSVLLTGSCLFLFLLCNICALLFLSRRLSNRTIL
jgi:hypothetical protein